MDKLSVFARLPPNSQVISPRIVAVSEATTQTMIRANKTLTEQ
ncbi:MAG: hypothetical protein ACQJCO_00800 [cyanobacterium endosymbiont of Rhopalodia sterrenbergii]